MTMSRIFGMTTMTAGATIPNTTARRNPAVVSYSVTHVCAEIEIALLVQPQRDLAGRRNKEQGEFSAHRHSSSHAHQRDHRHRSI